MANFSWDDVEADTSASTKILSRLKEIEDGRINITPEQNTAKIVRTVRQAGLLTAQKDINKFNKQVTEMNNVEQGTTVIFNSPAGLNLSREFSTKKLPVSTPTDMLLNAINSTDLSSGGPQATLFPASREILETRRKRLSRQAKLAMQREIVENARKRKQKTKNSSRRRPAEDPQVLIDRLMKEDPEGAEKLRQQYEIQRAEGRMLQDRNARRKWSKVARRFGGMSAERLITDQLNAEKDRRQLVEQLSGHKGSLVEDDSDQCDVDDVDGGVPPTQAKGLYAMKFMQPKTQDDSEFTELKAGPDVATARLEFLAAKLANLDSASGITNNERSQNPDETPATQSEADERVLGAELLAADDKEFADRKRRRAEKHRARLLADQEFLAKPVVSYSSANAAYFRLENDPTPASEVNTIEATAAQTRKGMVSLIFNLTSEQETHEFSEKVFQEHLQAVEKDAASLVPDVVPGWGAWVGEDIVDKRAEKARQRRDRLLSEKKNQISSELKKRSNVLLNPDACAVSSRYLIKANCRNESEATKLRKNMAIPVGSEFIPDNVSRRRTAAKYKVIRGQVVEAIKLSKK